MGKLTSEKRAEWKRQLRRDDRRQGSGSLARRGGPAPTVVEYCCLGLYACHVDPDAFDTTWTDDMLSIGYAYYQDRVTQEGYDSNYLPQQVDDTPLSDDVQHILASLNDASWTFPKIAKVLDTIDLRRQMINGDKLWALADLLDGEGQGYRHRKDASEALRAYTEGWFGSDALNHLR